MGTRGDACPWVFLLLVLFPSPPPGSIQTTTGTSGSCTNHLSHVPNSKCVNSTHATCRDGYLATGDPIFSDSTATCDDINECLRPGRVNCGDDRNCTNQPGSYYCTCIVGYESSSGKPTFRNANIDECLNLSRADCGPHANCTNTPGSYYCSCIDGYESSSGNAMFGGASESTCRDIDECQRNATVCEPHGICINTQGDYTCECKSGFGKSQKTELKICKDINECLGPGRADCGPNSNCTNLPGSYYCSCTDGYESSSGRATFRGASENTCRDIDECLGPSRADCGPHAHCTNVPGSYNCSCIDGYESSSGKATFRGASENTCRDIDECLNLSRADCGPHAHCTNTPGSYYCSCIDGFESESSSGNATFRGASENTCQDIDECLGPSRADCGPHTHCTNTAGSYNCSCIDGYESSSGKATFRGASESTCRDTDECLGPSRADCGPHANCTNTPGSYNCSCIDGFESSSGNATFRGASENTCQDIDECLGPSKADCGPHTHCTNVPGSYNCSCIDGYESSSGKVTFRGASENTCRDVNECLGPSRADCGPHADCTNTPGSYYCSCIDGYESSSGRATFRNASESTCRDIDECLGPSRADCGPHAHCTNTPGSYYCSCIVGYESSSGKTTFRNASENTCWDTDECLGLSRADCGLHANCTNTPGSYYCSCIDGYESSSGNATFRGASENTCQDIDECLRPSRADCGPQANCTNVPGNYNCSCIDGYESSSGKATFRGASENTCRVPYNYNCSAELERIKEMRRNCPLQGEPRNGKSSFCSFLNSTFEILTPTCRARTVALSLQEAIPTFSSLLNSTSLWDSLSKGEVESAMDVLLQNVEAAVLAIAHRSPQMTTQNMTTDSMAVETRLIPRDCSQVSEVFRLSAHGNTMDIHCVAVTAVATQGLRAAVAFISYSTLGSIINKTLLIQGNPPAGAKQGNSHLNSMVARQAEKESLCVYWKFVAGKGTWSPDGCTVLHVNSTHTTCRCDHLSSFAVLMAPGAVTESYALTVITYVGLTLSLLCLFLAILTFLLCRSIRNFSTSIHLQLCLCLFLANLLFLTTVNSITNKVVCAVIAGFLHYLFLASFTWMFLEGLHLFLTVRNLQVVNYTSASRFKKRYMYPFGYGFPALVVVISASLYHKGYGSPANCWLSHEKGFHWSFLGPVCVIILINTTFFALILRILRKKLSTLNTDVSNLRDHRLLTFKAIAQLFILGCAWILGLLQVGPAAAVMAHLFTIFNSLQGAFIFVVHCLLNRQVREEYRRWIKEVRTFSTKSQTYDVSMSTVRTADSKTT